MITGLSQNEAIERLKVYGFNDIVGPRFTSLKIFLKQFKSPFIYLLFFAAFTSFYVGEKINGAIILAIVFINSIISFYLESKAAGTIKSLRELIHSSYFVLRDGKKIEVDKKELVPDDIIFLKLGDVIPADCFVLESDELEIDESALTGESILVYKQANKRQEASFTKGIIYSGSKVIKGEVIGKIFATGQKSKFGEITYLSLNTSKPTEYEENLQRLTKDFLIIGISFLLFIFLAHLVFDKSNTFADILVFTIAITITIIPEALPMVVTLSLARSSMRLGKKGMVVKRTTALEDLGNISIICSDKTGTLTHNKLYVKYFLALDETEFDKLSYLSSFESNDPFDISIQEYLKYKNFNTPIDDSFTDIPFDPLKKYSGREFKELTIIKGIPEKIIALAVNKTNQKFLLDEIDTYASKGFRPLSLATKKGRKYQYIGTFFFLDKIKKDALPAIKKAEKLGVQIKIITGDSRAVSAYVGKEVGLIHNESQVIEATNLHFDNKTLLVEEVKQYTIFARADPVQKYKIIEALEQIKNVGYIGDGINDAPSLKLAHVGIVVDNAADVSKDAADIVLLNKNLSLITEGIIEGRKAFKNINKYVTHTLTGNLGNFFTIGLVSLFINFLPMLPVQILLNNLLVDIPSLGLATDTVDIDELKKPENYNISNLLTIAIVLAAVSSLFDLIYFIWSSKYDIKLVQTMWFVLSTLTELFVLFSIRTKKLFFNEIEPSKILLVSILGALVFVLVSALAGAEYFEISIVPIQQLIILIIFALLYFICTELVKTLYYKIHNQKKLQNQSVKSSV